MLLHPFTISHQVLSIRRCGTLKFTRYRRLHCNINLCFMNVDTYLFDYPVRNLTYSFAI